MASTTGPTSAAPALSALQLYEQAATCLDEQLDAVLTDVLRSFPGISTRIFTSALIGERKLGVSEACTRFKSVGWRLHPKVLTTLATAQPLQARMKSTWLQIPDFELALTLWDAPLDNTAKKWIGIHFMSFWQSHRGQQLSSSTLQRLRPLWQDLVLHANQKVPPSRACSLDWSGEETLKLLESHVDMNGDCLQLAQELRERALLTPALVNQHQGLIAALLQIDERWVVQSLLSGEITLEGPQPSIALLTLKALMNVLHPPPQRRTTIQPTKTNTNTTSSSQNRT